MKNALEVSRELEKRNKELTKKVMDYFQPLRERFVTKIRKCRINTKKFLWFKRKTYGDTYFDYMPLRIDVASTRDDIVYVKIYTCVGALNGDLYIIKEFPISLFEHNDYYIPNDDRIKKFISELISVATPKYVKYECFINHIQDEELKYKISNELEKLFESDEFKSLGDSDQCHEKTLELIKRLEKENGN